MEKCEECPRNVGHKGLQDKARRCEVDVDKGVYVNRT